MTDKFLIKDFAPPQKRGIGLCIDCDNYDQPSDEYEGICFDYEPGYGATISAVIEERIMLEGYPHTTTMFTSIIFLLFKMSMDGRLIFQSNSMP